MENHFLNLLALLFPPRFQKVESFEEACISPNDITALPLTEDGVMWRAYDVRKTGIEKMALLTGKNRGIIDLTPL